ncbi:hypothetical protein QN096_11320 [Metapseudomonas otitidis]|uniref:hypothetical protein n=1 Tax=Metapseudomonas otitidis TaxID=319939 RepID=UPI002541B4AC|nr:hypothetical protein [Pseudomonas otitidis]WIF69694.1 hypothetical protein QN096_11320 [Pseudomonas otitidis]
MPFKAQYEQPPMGYALNTALPNQDCEIIYKDFLSSENGLTLVRAQESLLSPLLALLPNQPKPHEINTLLAIYEPDSTVTIYCNELKPEILVRAREGVSLGQAVNSKHIAAVEKVNLGVEIENDKGFIFFFHFGWHAGLVFDFGPHAVKDYARGTDLNVELAHCYNRLICASVSSMSEDDWTVLFGARWFPFIGLEESTIRALIDWIRKGNDDRELATIFKADLDRRLPEIKKLWYSSDLIKPHQSFLDTALERYYAGDYISANSILYPRIEGILRDLTTATDNAGFRQKPLSRVGERNYQHTYTSRVLPIRFGNYLEEVYFKDFKPSDPTHSLGRNTVSHGVADAREFDLKSVAIGFFVVEQILFHFPKVNTTPEDS